MPQAKRRLQGWSGGIFETATQGGLRPPPWSSKMPAVCCRPASASRIGALSLRHECPRCNCDCHRRGEVARVCSPARPRNRSVPMGGYSTPDSTTPDRGTVQGAWVFEPVMVAAQRDQIGLTRGAEGGGEPRGRGRIARRVDGTRGTRSGGRWRTPTGPVRVPGGIRGSCCGSRDKPGLRIRGG